MKSLLRSTMEGLLLPRAKKVLKNARNIIGITGSIGKTSTRMAIKDILSQKYTVQTSPQNFNTRIGLLLSILDIPAAGKNPIEWFLILLKVYLKKLPNPEILILEYGIDSKGDMDELLKIAIPNIAVLTPITLAHTGAGQFSDIDQIRHEKLKLAHCARKVIANGFDKDTVETLRKTIPHALTTFGIDQDNDIPISETEITENGISFFVEGEKFFAPVFGLFQSQIFTPAILLGIGYGIPIEEIRQAIKKYLPPPGRGRIFSGINGSKIWDFSYNSSPSAAQSAITALKTIPSQSRKIALLGNMNELGKYSDHEHEKIGRLATQIADYTFFIGKDTNGMIRGAQSGRKIQTFKNAKQAGIFLRDFLQEGDFLLVKGSQNGVFLEAAISEILKNPDDKKFLCRQGEYWEKVREKSFAAH